MSAWPARSARRIGRALRSLDDRTPLRVKLVVAMLVLVTLGLAATGTAGAVFLHRQLLSQVDNQLQASAQNIVHSGRPGEGRPRDLDVDERREGGDRARPALNEAFFSQIFYPGGAPHDVPDLHNRAGGDQGPPKLPKMDAATVSRLDRRPFTTGSTGDGDGGWRVLVARQRDGSTVVVALSLERVDETVAELAVAEIVIGLLVLLALVGLAFVAIRSSLRPLMRVEATAEAIAAGDLGRRVPVGRDRTEVGRLARALNAMLAQIEAAFGAREASEAAARASEARMRRFIADASHELRTPLTSIRGFAELLHRQIEADPAAVATTTTRISAASNRMSALVDDLLTLARLDQQRPLHSQPVDLLAVVTDALAEFRVTAADHPIALRVPGDEDSAPAVVAGDELAVRQIVGNLLGNAAVHTPTGTPVTVTVETVGGGDGPGEAVLRVADAGPGLAPDVAERVFERFYRADVSRTRASGGTGLGLSIVAALVAAHGGTVGLRSAPGEGARFEVRLPLWTG